MRIDPVTLLFHDLTDKEAQLLLDYGEQVMLKGHVFPRPGLVEDWLQMWTESQSLLMISTVLPMRIFYSVLLHHGVAKQE